MMVYDLPITVLMGKELTILTLYDGENEIHEVVDTTLDEEQLQKVVDKIIDEFEKRGYDWGYNELFEEMEKRGYIRVYASRKVVVNV